MAIPISSYISIASKVSDNTAVGERDFSGLVFSRIAMKDTVDADYATVKANYIANKVVSLDSAGVKACFSDTTLTTFCDNYFGYSGGTKRPLVINLALVGSSETAADAFSRITDGTSTVDAFCNFGSFTFVGDFSDDDSGSGSTGGLVDVATKNEANEYGWVFVVGTNTTNQAEDSVNYNGKMLTHLTHTPWCAVAWYAAVDYSQANASGSIDFKQFSNTTATVTTASAKNTADALKVNYIGKVQTYGSGISFYQNGVNMNGTDIGVVRDACWINSKIVAGYFDLQNRLQKVPANYIGASYISGIIVSVASDAITAGAILIDKPLTSTQISEINEYAGNSNAAGSVSSCGYYVSTKIKQSGGKYVCEYTLIYAKGDHIQKVNGLHILI